ncbi:MAG: gentisate 1,2-dioxygenase [Rhizobiaceae bacterium]|nr:gentisate 1,2-dioxygenase [Rhizobiaceae bacterium]MCV0407929.1 gentisate 1,2-dioxygenase [Rhizobiaceae bacterium]
MATAQPNSTPEARQDFYDRLKPQNLAPLWEVLRGLLPSEPKSKAAPHCWCYADARPLLMESGELLTAQEAERRVLVLENPALPGMSRATSTMYAGLQLIMPGETAPAHRHSPSALRFMLEGEAAFTAVGGERTTMRRGDFIITPSWAWHDHGNEGSDPCAWLDGLDLPLVAFFEAGFNEHYNDERQSIVRPEGDALARFGSNMLPFKPVSRYGLTTPIFNYPFEQTRAALVAAAKGEAPDPHEAVTLRYSNPIDGGWAMPTMAAWMTFVPAGFETAPIRSTDGIVMALGEGAMTAEIGDRSFDLDESDVAVSPGWTWRRYRARKDSFLFCFSDRVAQEKLGLWREERGPAS